MQTNILWSSVIVYVLFQNLNVYEIRNIGLHAYARGYNVKNIYE